MVCIWCNGRNRLASESWLAGDNLFGRLNCGSRQLGFRTSLQPWHSFLKRFVEVSSCPEGCLAQPPDLDIGHVPELPFPVPLRCGKGKGYPEQCGRIRLQARENQSFKSCFVLPCPLPCPESLWDRFPAHRPLSCGFTHPLKATHF